MRNKLAFFFILLPIVVFFAVTIAFSQNIPYNDDYPAILQFLISIKDAGGFGDVLRLYFAPYGEHRFVFVRLFSHLQAALFGAPNFAVLPAIGNVGLAVAYAFWVRAVNLPRQGKLLLLVPTAFILFQLQSWSNYVWSMASLSNTLIFCWIVLALYFLFKSDGYRHFAVGVFCGLLATYTNGNGVFVFYAAALTFLLRQQWLKGALLLGLGILLLSINSSGASLTEKLLAQNPLDIFAKGLVFLGGAFFHPSYPAVAMVAGGAFIVLFCWLLFGKGYHRVNPVSFSLFMLIFVTAVGIATQRDILTIATSAPSRYRIYSTLLIMLSYAALLEVSPALRSKPFVYASAIASVLFFVASNVVSIDKLQNRHDLNTSYAFLLQQGIYVSKDISLIHNEALSRGIFQPRRIHPSALAKAPTAVTPNFVAPAAPMKYAITDTGTLDGYFFVKGWAGMTDNKNTLNKVWAVLENGTGAAQAYRANFIEVSDFINDKDMLYLATSGFLSVIPKREMDAANSAALSLSRGKFNGDLSSFYTIKPLNPAP